MLSRRSESGAVSLFLVIFAMLLITVVTLSFLRIMLQDQSDSSANDLSKSALDSAQAGVEDAKRELIYYRNLCNTGDPKCASTATAINSANCNIGLQDVVPQISDAVKNRGETTFGEVPVAQSTSSNDADYNQAYTCVKMQLDTKDYSGSMDANGSTLIPLKTNKNVTSINLSWYSPQDLTVSGTTVALTSGSSTPLPLQTAWAANRPSLMRAQLIQFGSTFTLANFDSSNTTNSNTNTLFLYPSGTTNVAKSGLDTTMDFTADVRNSGNAIPRAVKCTGTLAGGGYACTTTLNLPAPIGGGARTAYLRLTSLYNASHFTVTFNDATALFSGVQPSIDSTGRANDQYRRVSTRVDLMPTKFTYPEAAVDVAGNLCKDFAVTNVASEYATSTTSAGVCTP